MQSSGVAHVPAGLARCNGVVRLLVVEHDIRHLMPVGLMRTVRARLVLDSDGEKVMFRRFG